MRLHRQIIIAEQQIGEERRFGEDGEDHRPPAAGACVHGADRQAFARGKPVQPWPRSGTAGTAVSPSVASGQSQASNRGGVQRPRQSTTHQFTSASPTAMTVMAQRQQQRHQRVPGHLQDHVRARRPAGWWPALRGPGPAPAPLPIKLFSLRSGLQSVFPQGMAARHRRESPRNCKAAAAMGSPIPAWARPRDCRPPTRRACQTLTTFQMKSSTPMRKQK